VKASATLVDGCVKARRNVGGTTSGNCELGVLP
jgi:hypothetical protein